MIVIARKRRNRIPLIGSLHTFVFFCETQDLRETKEKARNSGLSHPGARIRRGFLAFVPSTPGTKVGAVSSHGVEHVEHDRSGTVHHDSRADVSFGWTAIDARLANRPAHHVARCSGVERTWGCLAGIRRHLSVAAITECLARSLAKSSPTTPVASLGHISGRITLRE